MLSPLLFNILFAAVLLIALERFSRNADILGDLVHLDESPKGMGPETALDVRDARRVGYAVRRRCLHCIAITARYCENDVSFCRSIRGMWSNRL